MKTATKERIFRRLQIIKGQLGGLEKMIADEKYCIDVITQSSAIRQALSSIDDLLLENHLSIHVEKQMKGGQGKKATAEVLKVYKLAQRR